MNKSLSLLLLPIVLQSGQVGATEQTVDLSLGKTLYGQACIKCHDTAKKGAPRPYAPEDWKYRSHDVDLLVKNVISGPTHMPPKGGTRTDSSGKLKAVISYMLNTVKSAPVAVDPQKYQTLAMGKKLYNQLCYSCHDTGEKGAPIIGYMPHWKDRIKLGKDALVQSVIEGKGMMIPKGGGAMNSKAKYASIVDYMLAAVQRDDIANSPEMIAQVKRSREISNGLKLYNQLCFSCHNTGELGAPQLGNNADWAGRREQGVDTLVQHAIEGHGLMGQKGGGALASIEGMKSMVMYMLSTLRKPKK